jgi:uncharacterized protein (DUF433 family)
MSFAVKVCMWKVLSYPIQNRLKKENFLTRSIDYNLYNENDLDDTQTSYLENVDNATFDNYDLDSEYIKKVIAYAIGKIKTAKRRANVKAIIELLLDGSSQQKIAKGLGVSRQAISHELKQFKMYCKEALQNHGFWGGA